MSNSIQSFGENLWNGVKQGAKNVVNSYTGGSSKEENIGSKVGAVVVGGVQGGKAGKAAADQAVASATTRVEKSAAQKATSKIVTTAIVKGASKALGIVGFIPDAITFGKGFYEGYTANGK